MRLSISIFFALMSLASVAQTAFDPAQSCTSIMVGRKASTDGSVMTSHTCDGGYRSNVYVREACDYPRDTTVTIFKGTMMTDYATDRSPLVACGTIPQVAHTFGYLDTAYPCINEKQLAMGETTVTGRPELKNPKGLFMIEELQRIAMERCITARQAITLMGELVKDYGYGDSGECLTIADPKEVWHFEIFGEGPDTIGGVWAAVRIPDDHVGVSANISRISQLNLTDSDHFMASDNVKDVALKMGLWDGKEPFSFFRAYGTNYAHPNEKKNFDIREYFILNSLAPSQKFDFAAEELPISVKPDKKVSVEDVLALFRQTYAGTEYDPTKELKITQKRDSLTDTITCPRANPWLLSDDKKLLSYLHGSPIAPNRPVAVAFCSYATVIQVRDWLPDDVGGVVWLALDNPGQSPRIPLYCGLSRVPRALGTNGNNRFMDQAAIWKFRTANKLAALRWPKHSQEFLSAINHFEQKALDEMPYVEQRYKLLAAKDGRQAARDFLADYSADFFGATMLRWEEMGRDLMMQGRFGF